MENNVRVNKKKMVLIVAAIFIISVVALIAVPRFISGEENVAFKEVEEGKVPSEISSEVLPEYRTLERALACIVNDDVYVIVTRGEKPSSGFGVSIDKMMIEEENDNKNLIVYANFDDPDKETPISQIITYPTCIVKTELSYLPDNIELRIQY